MSSTGVIASFVMTIVLLWSSLEKLRTIKNTSETFLDFRRWINPLIAVLLLSLAELLCVIGLLIAPSSTITVFAVLGLATIFATGGVWAILAKKQIRCNCFGTLGSDGATLGKSQLVWFVVWLAGIGAILRFPPPSRTVETVAAMATMATLFIAGVRAIEASRAARISKGDRLSADRMLTWLH